jgi:RND superfamily putative drug exporter
MRMGLPGDSTAPTDTTARTASGLTTEAFGPGRPSPLLVVVDGRDVAHAASIGSNRKGATVLVQPTADPESVASGDLLSALRGTAAIEKRTEVTLGVTGTVAVRDDVSTELGSALVPYLAIVIGLAFPLLVRVFRVPALHPGHARRDGRRLPPGNSSTPSPPSTYPTPQAPPTSPRPAPSR